MTELSEGTEPTAPQDTPEPGELARLAERVAREVGDLVRRMRAEAVEVAATKSSDTDVVTRADLAAERRVAELLAVARPNDGLLGEEGAARATATGLTWVVDPIDGTVNYLYGRSEYAVSVAVVRGDATDLARLRPVAGCVHAPELGLTYTAAAGQGAWRDGVRLDPRRAAAPALAHALVGTGFSYSSRVREAQGATLATLLAKVRDVRRSGCAALDVCAVADGRLDAHYEIGLNPWDIAAAMVAASEVGAQVRIGPLGDDGRRLVLVAPEALADRLGAALAVPAERWEQTFDPSR